MSFNLTANLCPVPTGPLTAPSLAACTSTSTTNPTLTALNAGATSGLALGINQAMAAIGGAAGFGGLGHLVINGLGLSVAAGLNIQVAPGIANITGSVEIVAATNLTLPNSTAHVYIWLKQDHSLTYTSSITPPQNDAVYLGNCVTAAGAIALIDYSGVCYYHSGLMYRTTADKGAPADAPTSNVHFITKTSAGDYLWTGAKYRPLGPVVNIETITATRQLTSLDAPRQIITPSGADRIVKLAATPSWDQGPLFIHNGGTTVSTWNVLLQNSDGSANATITPGQQSIVPILIGGASASASYPTTTTPGTPTM